MDGADLITFDITVENPCYTTTINSITFGSNPLPVTDSQDAYTEWSPPSTQADLDYIIDMICGEMTFEVFSDSDGTDTIPSNTWAIVT